MEKEKSAVVFVIIEAVEGHEGKIPLLQEKDKLEPRMWKLPGGAMENNEWPEITAYREVQEETGLLVERLDENAIIYDEIKKGRSGEYRFMVFRAKYMRGTTLVGDEVEKIGFFSRGEVENLIKNKQIVPTHIPALKKWLDSPAA